MLSAKGAFEGRVQEARHLVALFDYLTAYVQGPMSYDDLLRFQIVYAVSAFDKLMHDLIRVGMLNTYVGTRHPTAKYHAEGISLKVHASLAAATVPPAEILFEQEVARKLKILSFQDPTKVADGLALVWAEKHKWQCIATAMGVPEDQVTTRLKLIAARRNSIVHEADMDPVTGQKNPISRSECIEVTDFVDLCGCCIADLLIAS